MFKIVCWMFPSISPRVMSARYQLRFCPQVMGAPPRVHASLSVTKPAKAPRPCRALLFWPSVKVMGVSRAVFDMMLLPPRCSPRWIHWRPLVAQQCNGTALDRMASDGLSHLSRTREIFQCCRHCPKCMRSRGLN